MLLVKGWFSSKLSEEHHYDRGQKGELASGVGNTQTSTHHHVRKHHNLGHHVDYKEGGSDGGSDSSRLVTLIALANQGWRSLSYPRAHMGHSYRRKEEIDVQLDGD
eukprot:c23946_g1_i1.p1 GENE.c23946_g1_i1~~c23946_g1_i1.p1  ORF type:complete len:106 (+),score=0.01 c23946_g1_i1:501-818(+)